MNDYTLKTRNMFPHKKSLSVLSGFVFYFLLLFSMFFIICGTAEGQTSSVIDSIVVRSNQVPLIASKINNFAFTIKVYANPGQEKVFIRNVKLKIDKPELLRNLKVVGLPFIDRWITQEDDKIMYLTLGSEKPGNEILINGELPLIKGENLFYVSILPKENAELTEKIQVTVSEINGGDLWSFSPVNASGSFRMALCLRSAGQDNVHTYRIPGLATTNKSTLIAVYDVRYNNNRDLQEDIDVGMSRSIDGGQTWEPMRIIMDMGNYGGLPDSKNGIGDPAVLVDKATNTIWVAALWIHGNYSSIQNNRFSQRGLVPEPDGRGSQVVLVKSEDDGLTWSAPINITAQVKNPAWDRFLQGPGSGITLSDGTLVFASQFFDPEQHNSSCSNIFFSSDHGKTWKASTSSVSGGSEAQVAELSDGTLMLNMRSNRKARLISTTKDMGETWSEHATSAKALPEPGCMASLIGYDVNINGTKKRILFFSNPDNTTRRLNMTLKTSLDYGETWPGEFQIQLNESPCYGYSCLAMVGKHTIGILYEGINELFFQKIPLKDIIRNY